MEYGTGAIMAVPAHDERDFEFATKFDLPIVRVVAGEGQDAESPVVGEAHTHDADGRLVNSDRFDGLTIDEGKAAIVAWLAEQEQARAVTNYRLHDWCISRQRYWGPPIPIVYCDDCGTIPVPVEQLPVVLPHIDDFKPDDSGISPLARHAEWYHVPCPRCGGPARRETDVSDTFLDSAWYFLRYPSARRDDVPFDRALTDKWLPVDSYIGGNEHAVLHLLYSRFITMVLQQAGHIDFDEPFTRFRAHGLIIREGAKMSKSKGNVVNPDDMIERWGADTFRTYLMFLGPVRGGRRLPRRGHQRRAALPRPAVRERARHDARRNRGHGRAAQAAPDHPQGLRRPAAPVVQHGDRGDDGVRQRAPEGRAHAAPRRGHAAGAAGRVVRAASRRGAVGAGRERGQRVRRDVAGVRSVARGRVAS